LAESEDENFPRGLKGKEDSGCMGQKEQHFEDASHPTHLVLLVFKRKEGK